MNDKGYTRIPNAIIRTANITPSERSAWCLIASIPEGYALTIKEACAMLGYNEKTWRWCVAELTRKGMIIVEHVPGQANVYRVEGDTKKWHDTPAKNWYYQKTAPLPKNGTTPLPKIGRGTHSNKKEQLKNNIAAARAHAREESIILRLKIYDQWSEAICMKHHIDPTRWDETVEAFVLDMRCRNQDFIEITDIRAYFNGWLNKRENEQRATNQSSGDPGDKLDRDAVKAMAALAAQSQQPVEPTW